MIRDRGNIKWSAMMLPEHTKMLKTIYEEQHDVEMLLLDEDKLEELDKIFTISLEKKRPLEIHYYQDHRFHCITGNLKDYKNAIFEVLDQNDKSIFISVTTVIDANFSI